MFVTRDPALHARALTLSNHGRARGQTRQFWAERIGFKYKMSNIQAAIGCAQVERWDELVARKRQIFSWYAAGLADLPLVMNPERQGDVNGYWMPTIIVDGVKAFNREVLLARFKTAEIDGRVFFWPLSMQPMFDAQPANVVSYGLYRRGVNLPSYHDMTLADVDRVCAVVRSVLSR